MQAYGSKSRKPCFRAAQFLYAFGAIGASAWRRAFAANQLPSSPIPLLALSARYLLPIICTPNR
jgi:hypothetical protein